MGGAGVAGGGIGVGDDVNAVAGGGVGVAEGWLMVVVLVFSSRLCGWFRRCCI